MTPTPQIISGENTPIETNFGTISQCIKFDKAQSKSLLFRHLFNINPSFRRESFPFKLFHKSNKLASSILMHIVNESQCRAKCQISSWQAHVTYATSNDNTTTLTLKSYETFACMRAYSPNVMKSNSVHIHLQILHIYQNPYTYSTFTQTTISIQLSETKQYETQNRHTVNLRRTHGRNGIFFFYFS